MDRENVIAGLARPAFHIERMPGRNLVDRDALQLDGFYRIGEEGIFHAVDEPGASPSNDFGVPVRIEQNRRALIDTDAAHRGLAEGRHFLAVRLVGMGKKHQQTAHAVASGEMRVGEDAFENRNVEEPVNQSHTRFVPILEDALAVEIRIVGLVALRRIDPFAHAPPGPRWFRLSARRGGSPRSTRPRPGFPSRS